LSRNGVGAALRGIRSVPRGCALARRGAARVEGSADTSGSVTGTGGGIGTSHRWVVTANTPAGQVASAWHFEGVTAVTARDGSHGICVGRRRGRGVGAEMTRAHARGRPSQVRLPPAAWPAARFHNPRTSGDDGTSVATLSRWSGNNLARLVVGGSVTWATLVVMRHRTEEGRRMATPGGRRRARASDHAVRIPLSLPPGCPEGKGRVARIGAFLLDSLRDTESD